MFVGLFKIRPQLTNTWASLIAQLVKNLPAVLETPVQFLGREDPLDKGYPLQYSWASLVAQMVKNLPAVHEIPVQFRGQEDPLDKGYPLQYSWASLVAQMIENLPAMWETWLWSLGWEDPLEKGKATCSSILVQPLGSQTVRHDWATFTSLHQYFLFFSMFFLSGIYLDGFYCCVFKFIYLLVISNLPLVICSVL